MNLQSQEPDRCSKRVHYKRFVTCYAVLVYTRGVINPFFFFGATVYAYASELASFDLLIVKSTMIVCISAYGRRCVLLVTVN